MAKKKDVEYLDAKKFPKVVKILPKRSGKIKDVKADVAQNALAPGKRISKTGNVYWETRRNRSDAVGSKI